MTPSKASDLPTGSTLKAYKIFHQAAGRGESRKAFAIFKSQPHLINHMTLIEIAVHCRMTFNRLPKRQAIQFIGAIEKRLMETVRLLEMVRLYDHVLRKGRLKEPK